MGLMDLFRSFHQRPVKFYPIHKALTGRTTTAILLSFILDQLEYYNCKKYFATDAQVMDATTLSEKELRSAKEDLKEMGFIQAERLGVLGKCHYSIDEEILKKALENIKETCRGDRHIPQEIAGSAERAELTEIAGSCSAERAELAAPKGRDSYKEEFNKKKKNTLSAVQKDRPTTTLSLDDKRWLRWADQLVEAISFKHKVSMTPARCGQWAGQIRLLHVKDGIDKDRIKTALDWYHATLRDRKNDQYTPIADCGKEFREKFPKLERAMERENQKRESDSEDDDGSNDNPSAFTTIISREATPEEIAAAEMEDNV